MTREVTQALTAAMVLALGLLGSGFTPLAAQNQSLAGGWNGQWSGSIGADPFVDGSASPKLEERFVAALAREWSRPGSRLAWRAELSAGRQPTTTLLLNSTEGCGACSITSGRGFGEVSATAVYSFRRGHSFRPYFLGGPGLFALRSTYSAHGVVMSFPDIGDKATKTVWSLGATAGAGVAFRLFGREMFVEQKWLLPEPTTGYRRSSGIHPLSIGIKF